MESYISLSMFYPDIIMDVIKARAEHKDAVLGLLDEFRTACIKIISPEKDFTSTTAKDSGGPFFDKLIGSSNTAIFLVKKDDSFIGIAVVNKIPQVRKGIFYAEIEEMFVKNDFQGSGAALLLIDTISEWAKKENIKTVRLESSNELKRAHKFYEKVGFRFYGRAYEKIIK